MYDQSPEGQTTFRDFCMIKTQNPCLFYFYYTYFSLINRRVSLNLLQLRQIAFGGVYVANAQQLKSITDDSDNNKSVFRKIMSWKIGVIDLPVYLVLAAIILTAAYFNKIPANMLGGFAVIMILGIFLGDVGQRIPILKDIGGPAILSLFVPSFLVFLMF